MKIATLQLWGLALALALGPFVGGCDEEQAHSATLTDTLTNTTSLPQPDSAPADTNPPAAAADQQLANAPGTVISTPNTVPNTSSNPQFNDVVKLAQAGVGETILMAYITNAPGTFNVSSDDILYLNDLGVPETVVNAMIQHDQAVNSGATQPPVQPTAPPADANPSPDQNAMAQGTMPPDAAVTPPLTPSPDVLDDSQQAPNGSYSYFYDSLSPYGNWIDVAGYGPCWQPTVVVANPGWTPYCDRGHWAYTDCGWCWVSDYTWGWAPFHYGRWFHHSHWGWCWAPDTVWGPAWVSWRYNATQCGWAPLPPAACYRPGYGFTFYGQSVGFNFTFGLGEQFFVFVPLNHFTDRHVGSSRLNPREASKVFNNTTLNNQIIRGGKNTLINLGVPVERVAAAAHTQIHPIHIRTDVARPGATELGRDGRSLSLYRPTLPAPKWSGSARLVGEGVPPAANFDLRSHVEWAAAGPANSSIPEHHPIISHPATAAPRNGFRPENPPGEINNPVPDESPNLRHGPVLQPKTPAPAVPEQRWDQPTAPTPRQESPRIYNPAQEQPRGNNREFDLPANRDLNPPARSEPASPRTYEPRSAPPAEAAPSQHQDNNQNNQNGSGGNWNGNNNGNGNGWGRGH